MRATEEAMKNDTTRCAACDLRFLPGEAAELHGDGTATHETTNPDSMERCRDELLRKLRAAEVR
jgi:hypothetical protein